MLTFAALAYAFDGFFLGLTRGKLLSRAMAVSLVIGFAPAVWAALHYRQEDLLWLGMAGLMAARAGTLGFAARRTIRPNGEGAGLARSRVIREPLRARVSERKEGT